MGELWLINDWVNRLNLSINTGNLGSVLRFVSYFPSFMATLQSAILATKNPAESKLLKRFWGWVVQQ